MFSAKLHLIDVGRMKEAMELDDEMASVTREAGAGRVDLGSGKMSKAVKQELVGESARGIDDLLDRKLAMLPDNTAMSANSANGDGLTLHERAARRKVLKEFQAACTKCLKCANCSAFSPKIRHDQFNKIFQQGLAARNRKSNLAERIRIRPACVSLDENGSGVDQGLYDDDDDDYEGDDDFVDSEDEVMDDEEDEEDANSMIDDEAQEENGNSMKKKTKKKDTSKSSKVDEEVDPTGGHISRKATVSTTKVSNQDAPKQDKFMHPLEVEAQARLTWHKEPFLCSKFFGCAHAPEHLSVVVSSEDENGATTAMTNARPRSTSNAAEAISGGGKGYTMFFIRAVPVPPSRFRPPVIMGTMTVEHSQNYYLSKVLEMNARIRSAFATIHDLTQEELDLKNLLAGGDTTAAEDNGGKSNNAAGKLKKIRDNKDKTQANSLASWVDMQTTVNCFMDSSRDPKGTANNAPNGIRQLLEKKEGIFRK